MNDVAGSDAATATVDIQDNGLDLGVVCSPAY